MSDPTVSTAVRPGGDASAAAPAVQHVPWDVLQIALTGLILLQVWRVHDLFRFLAFPGLPVLATAVSVGLFLLNRAVWPRVTSLNQPIARAALGLVLIAALSIPGSLYPSHSMSFLLKDYLRSVILMLLIGGSIRGLTDLRRFAWVHVLGLTVLSAVILSRASITAEGRLGKTDAYYDVNDLATLIVCTLPLIVYLWRRPTGLLARLILVAATVLLMVAFGKTGSRGGFLGFVVVGGYLLLRLRGVSGVQRVGAVALLVVLLIGLASDRYFDRIQSLLNPSADYNWTGKSDTGRLEIWKRGLGYMMDHPFLGVGANDFAVAEGTLSPEGAESARYGHRHGFKWSAAHNSFIQIGAELGVFGLMLFLLLLWRALRTLARIRRFGVGGTPILAQILIASLTGYAVTALFLSQAYSAYFYTILGMILGLARIAAPPRPRPPGPQTAFSPLAPSAAIPSHPLQAKYPGQWGR